MSGKGKVRAAQFIRSIPASDLVELTRQVEACGASLASIQERAWADDMGFITPFFMDLGPAQEAILGRMFGRRPAKVLGPDIYATLYAAPHVDETFYDYTVGVVLAGDHVLYTGRGHPVCDLEPGVIYLLNNKRMHGAKPRDKRHPTPLVFITADFVASSMQDALGHITL